MKIKIILFLPQLSFVLSFFASTSATDFEGGVGVEARPKTPTTKFDLKSIARPSQRTPSLALQRLANKDTALPLKKIDHNDLRHLFEVPIGEEVFIQERMAQLTSMDTRAAEQIRKLLQNSLTTARLAHINIDPQNIGLKKQKTSSTTTYQLYCGGQILSACKPFQVSFHSKDK